MPQQESSALDKVHVLVGAHARECLADLGGAGCAPRVEMAVEAGQRWQVLVVAFPTLPGAEVPGLTESARDCLALLAQAREPLSAVRVRRDLERRGVGIYGIATVKRALIKLRQIGFVANSRKSPRGYYLLDHGPLFRHRT
jgi:hypothetical protein